MTFLDPSVLHFTVMHHRYSATWLHRHGQHCSPVIVIFLVSVFRSSDSTQFTDIHNRYSATWLYRPNQHYSLIIVIFLVTVSVFRCSNSRKCIIALLRSSLALCSFLSGRGSMSAARQARNAQLHWNLKGKAIYSSRRRSYNRRRNSSRMRPSGRRPGRGSSL
jgi:hypothetical protein